MSHVEDYPVHALKCMEIRGGSRAVREAFTTPGLDVWLDSQPFEGADHGGDVHYVSVCGGGVITRAVVADVSGHGEIVAGFSEALRALMRKNINHKSQTSMVQALNRQFGESARSLRFATAVVATYLAHRQTLTLCNAGHPRPLWYRALTQEWELLDHELLSAGNLPLGLEDDTPYNQFRINLGKGDIILLYTDALIEAANASDRQLGEQGLLGLVRQLDPSQPERLSQYILDAVAHHRGGLPPDDDVTLLTLHHNATGPRRLSLSEKLDTVGKLLGLKSY